MSFMVSPAFSTVSDLQANRHPRFRDLDALGVDSVTVSIEARSVAMAADTNLGPDRIREPIEEHGHAVQR